ncbi:hypothetical protein ACFO25_07050 [Paenactinomyces guangxiensis]|uniref:Uncharacterized protein n=1 Tax=Paenactinomyces guangxiensis TaxID=1490290 RepID=A0A7W1WNK2_9BACL|nr:hypothetical protein [Paenactinomyces guangxiensis]MBA4493195.1 hypothetical protein [Paenactinomyces guangxiensis]MBH8589955.1 hypothetical protein [Paenactinomyces guangxiensis]
MNPDFFSYDAYLERYKMFYNEEGDGRPSILSEEQFKGRLLLKECYQAYEDLVQTGQIDRASNYYSQVINKLENELAMADASDNLHIQMFEY